MTPVICNPSDPKVGEKTRAKQELKSILESGKSFSERDKAEALLQELQSETG